MILILGGAGQGKLTYASEHLHLEQEKIADGAVCDGAAVLAAGAVRNYQLLVRRLGEAAVPFTQQLCRDCPDAVILLEEVGCGIVPMEKSERLWREEVGRCGCILAAHAETVIRMVCGIPTAIKGVLP